MHFNPKWLVAALSGVFSNCFIAKTEFRIRKKFRWGWSIQLWYQSIPPRSKGLGMGPTTTTPKIIKFWNCLPSMTLKILRKITRMFEYGKFLKSNVLASLAKPMINFFLSIWLFLRGVAALLATLKHCKTPILKFFSYRYIFQPVSVLSFPRFLLHSYHNLLYLFIGWLSRLNYASLRTIDHPYGYIPVRVSGTSQDKFACKSAT